MMKEISTLDYLLRLLKWRKWILINFLAVCLVTAGISFLLPKWYRATATIMPPTEEMGELGLSPLTVNLAQLGFIRGPEKSLAYLAILESRTVMESVARKFDLASVYKTKNMEATIDVLRSKVDVQIQQEGTITVSVLDKDPQRAADLANAFVYYLDSLNTELNIEKARNNRIFIEKRYEENKRDLKKTEEALKAFQQTYGAISLPEQTKAAIMAAADLQAQIIALEVELGVKERSLSPTHQEVIQLKTQLSELKKKLNKIKFGNEKGFSKGQTMRNNATEEFFIPFIEIPEVGLEYARLLREVEVQSKLYELLTQQYEQAKIQEAKDTPTVQVLDKAVPPLKKAKPKRVIITLTSGISCTIIFILFIFIYERIQIVKERDKAKYDKISSIFTTLRNDLKLWGKRG